MQKMLKHIHVLIELFDDEIEILEENGVYLFSAGVIKMANKRFTSIKNDFCIIFERHSQIVKVIDDGSI